MDRLGLPEDEIISLGGSTIGEYCQVLECSDCEIGNVDGDMTDGNCNAGFDWGFVDWLVK